MMLFVVTLISLLVHIYSHRLRARRPPLHPLLRRSSACSPRRCSFFVLGANTLQMIVGWELVGLCSFVLIGHWWEEKPNSDAALKAFLTNRVGDVGLLIGMIILFFAAGADASTSLKINEHGRRPASISHLLLLVGVVLPDRRGHVEVGPVPPAHLAARRHGRPDAGVRAHPRRHHGRGRRLPGRPPLRACSSTASRSATASINLLAVDRRRHHRSSARCLAFVQNDIKKVLAYSTVSQLGYMVMALGVGAWTGGAVPPLHPRLLQGAACSSAPARSATPCTTAST